MVYNKLKLPVLSEKLHNHHKKTSLWVLFHEVACLELGAFLWILWYFSENQFAEH